MLVLFALLLLELRHIYVQASLSQQITTKKQKVWIDTKKLKCVLGAAIFKVKQNALCTVVKQ